MDDDTLPKVLDAIRLAQQRLRWRPGKSAQHLRKRIELGLLDQGTSLSAYEAIIRQILGDVNAHIYTFSYDERYYPTVVADLFGRRWLVIIDMAGTMETAFVVEKPDIYFAAPRFALLGRAEELMK